jgi:hypothetical protein
VTDFYAAWDAQSAAKTRAPLAASANGRGAHDHPYLDSALRTEADTVAHALEGTRNHTLNTAAFSLGQLVDAGLDEAVIRDQLAAAAAVCGLDTVEAERTITSGLAAGRQLPRPIPEGDTVPEVTVLIDAVPAVVTPSGPVTVALADVTPEHVDWLWFGRLPVGKLVVLDGDPSVGKSTLAVDFAARLSVGLAWPDGAPCPAGSTLILSAEDGLADTIRPRLDAAGGDPTRVHALTSIAYTLAGAQRTRPPTLADVDELEHAVLSTRAVLVVIDVLMAYMPGRADSHRDQDVRGVLSAIAAMADRTRCVVLLLRHLNKSASGPAMYRGGGSIGIVGAARVGLLAANDPDDETRRVLAALKHNLSAKPDALAYQLVDSPEHGCARVQWLGASTHSAEALLAYHGDEDERAEHDAAVEWLRGHLIDSGGEAIASDVFKAASRDGYAKHTVQRARKRAGVESGKDGMRGPWIWRLATPEDDTKMTKMTAPGTLSPSSSSVSPSQAALTEEETA